MLEDGDFKLTESSAILKYLADKIGSPAYPKDLKERAKVNEVMDWLNTNFYRDWGYGLRLSAALSRTTSGAATRRRPARSNGAQNNSKNWLKLLNDHWIGPKNQYLCGDQITIADYFGAGLVTLGELIGCDFSPYPNVQRWLDNMKKLPSWDKRERGLLRAARAGQGAAISCGFERRRHLRGSAGVRARAAAGPIRCASGARAAGGGRRGRNGCSGRCVTIGRQLGDRSCSSWSIGRRRAPPSP